MIQPAWRSRTEGRRTVHRLRFHAFSSMRVFLLLVALLVLAGCAGRSLMPTPNLYSTVGREPFEQIAPELRSSQVDLLYVTDRAPELDEQGNPGYGHKRSYSMAFGSATVEIGENAGWEQLERDSRRRKREARLNLRLSKVVERGRFPETPYPFTIIDGKVIDDERSVMAEDQALQHFREELQRRLTLTPKKELLIYIHGYNNHFDDAAFTLAELWHFMGREGVPLLYTWPAGRGGLTGYAYDRESGEFTIFQLKQLLRALTGFPEVEKIHILAHSRGTDVAVSAVRELAIEARAAGRDPKGRYRIANLILAAPDMDLEVMTQRIIAERVGQAVGQVTVYTSKGDKAIEIAEKLFGGIGRLGRVREGTIPPEAASLLQEVDSVTFVESRVKGGLIGHVYFHSHPATSSDLVLVIRDGRRPGARHGRPLEAAAGNLWVLKEDYPSTPKSATVQTRRLSEDPE